ncbi:hypothetical protein X798_03531 [Onchocerca flexuosa]|uniref:Phosphorylase b kinase regulatory subunit n=2 Tax=Onchocerca flexuosa TaxID=387005 RepID=A0A183GZD2_9BILA|nr:hypothetical protein X798_03530 [Onchocerca flexuosa]OZC09371.1 hypothetical protein X798_03531 [Onchocerca flexuosa]VDO26336.1 unnamed protein product [Onchocerca flexuosa]
MALLAAIEINWTLDSLANDNDACGWMFVADAIRGHLAQQVLLKCVKDTSDRYNSLRGYGNCPFGLYPDIPDGSVGGREERNVEVYPTHIIISSYFFDMIIIQENVIREKNTMHRLRKTITEMMKIYTVP